jgi:hypothetical protein
LAATGWQTQDRLDKILVTANTGICLLSCDCLLKKRWQMYEVYNLILTILESLNLVYSMSEKYLNKSCNSYLRSACVFIEVSENLIRLYLHVVTLLIHYTLTLSLCQCQSN